jgi:hypothetical protein
MKTNDKWTFSTFDTISKQRTADFRSILSTVPFFESFKIQRSGDGDGNGNGNGNESGT